MAAVQRLARTDEAALEELLDQDPVVNLFLIGFLSVHPVDRAWWYGIHDGPALSAVVLVLPGRLAVPWMLDADVAHRVGAHLRGTHRPTMMVGPRQACDALWSGWTGGAAPSRCYDQRLYVLDQRPAGVDPPGFRRGTWAEWQPIATYSGQMELEDLGFNPYDDSPKLHEQVVQERLKAGRTWVISEQGEIRFQLNVGTTTWQGCQVGGTYVPPRFRGRGYAKAGVAATCRRLLDRYPRVTLHVNEANAPAVRVYEGVGFSRASPFRLITP